MEFRSFPLQDLIFISDQVHTCTLIFRQSYLVNWNASANLVPSSFYLSISLFCFIFTSFYFQIFDFTKFICEFSTLRFCFSHSEQREAAIEQRKMVEDLFNAPYYFFSHTLDLTNSQQKLDGLMENDAKGYFVLGTASPSFTWNCKFLLMFPKKREIIFEKLGRFIILFF